VVTESTLKELELLAEVSQLLTMLDLPSMLKRVVELGARLVDAERADLVIREDAQWKFVSTGYSYPEPFAQEIIDKVIDQGLVGWSIHNKCSVLVTDTSTDPRWYRFPDDIHSAGSALSVPLIYGDEILGAITLAHPETGHFSEYHLRLLTIIGNQVAVSINNARLLKQTQAQRHQFEAVLQAMPDILLVIDEHGQVLLVSDAILPLLDGHNTSAVVGRPVSRLTLLDDVFAPIERMTSVPPPEYAEWTVETRSDKRERDFLVNVSVWQDPYLDRVGYVVVMKDITTMRNLTRFKDDILRLVSHDLRTPVVLIISYADMMKMDLADAPAQIHEWIDGVHQAAERMDRMLENLLRAEQVRSSPLELAEAVDMAGIVRKLTNELQSLAARKSITLYGSVPEGRFPRVIGDSMMLQQAVENLIANAIKYTPEEGEVRTDVYVDENLIHVVISDNGRGIPADEVPKLFEKYFRADTPETHAQRGTGLGLSFVKNVIEQHGGRVWVQSIEGEGSSFGFWLPLPPVRS
jgi:PAS domain S-box-containing protein